MAQSQGSGKCHEGQTMSVLPMGIPAPPAGFRISAPGRFESWAKTTDVPVPDWHSYFSRCTPEMLKAIGVWLAGQDLPGICTLESMALEEAHKPSERCLFTVIRRPKDKATTWYVIRRMDPMLRVCHTATIKRTIVDDWQPCRLIQSTRTFTIQLPGDSFPQDVLDAAVDRGFKL